MARRCASPSGARFLPMSRTPAAVSAPANAPIPAPFATGTFLIQRAEELLGSLPGVVSARIVADAAGAISEIHVLTTVDIAPKATVRNIESALIAHLGMRVDHRKISVATTMTPARPRLTAEDGGAAARPAPEPAPADSGRRIYFDDVEVIRSRSKGVTCRVMPGRIPESGVTRQSPINPKILLVVHSSTRPSLLM